MTVQSKTRKKPFSATKYTLAWLRKSGWQVAVTERWNPFAKIRQDLFGFCDVLAVKETILAIQCTTSSNLANRKTKILAEPRAAAWMRAGGSIWVIGWKKVKNVWEPRIEVLKQEDFQ